MEEMEPWNMFSRDFVAEETEELLTDELMAEYGQRDDNLTVVKREATDGADDGDVPINSELSNAKNYSRVHKESNDDELFNFSLEPQADIAVQGGRQGEIFGMGQGSHQRIDYDVGVIFVCPACGLEMDSHDDWKRHIDAAHKYSTRRGLNFVPLDKLYHQCLECKRKIAMHSMENLMKHKFTHLPFKRVKCRICFKQYKYRQDIMVHLRQSHREEMLSMSKLIKHREIVQTNVVTATPPTNFEIKNVQENAVDIFESTEGIEVKSEPLLDDDDADAEADEHPASSTSIQRASSFDESLSRSSSHLSDTSMLQQNNVLSKEELCEKFYIQYICPQCGLEFPKQPQWRQHIEYVHNYGTRRALNFRELNMKQQAQCLECSRVLNVNAIRNLQLHKFTHLPYKSWLRCKLCFRTFVGQKEIMKHLLTQHRLGEEPESTVDSQDGHLELDDEQEGSGEGGAQSSEQNRDERPNDCYEPHIDYLCPQCGKEYFDKRLWRKHIVKVHHLTDMKVLNFKIISDHQVICLECSKTITNAYGVQNAQQHKFTHLPYKAYVRCRLCSKCYTDRKGCVKHLKSRHRLGDGIPPQTRRSYSPATLEKVVKTANQLSVQKEIVKHADFTFEIKYLDDTNNGNDVVDDDTPVPELNFSGSLAQFPSLRCKQCPSVFTTLSELQAHINEEHEFLDFNNLRPLPESPRCSYRSQKESSAMQERAALTATADMQENRNEQVNPNESREDFLNSNDSNNDLLVPTGDEEVSTGSHDAAAIERNFCYLCPKCGFECATQMLWRRHINEVHSYDKRQELNFRQLDKLRYQCQQCMEIVTSSKLKGLQDHKFRHLPYRLYIKCILCGTCYNHKPNMLSHLRQRHNIIDTRIPLEAAYELMNSTPQQPRSTPSRSPTIPAAVSAAITPPAMQYDDLSYHNAVDHESITYFCPQCNENFAAHVQWRKHIVEQHNLNSKHGLNFRQVDEHHFLCLQCYKRVTVTHSKGAIGQLQSHKFRHLPYKSFKCKTCNGDFVRKQMFFKHLNRTTNKCDSKPCVVEQAEDKNSPKHQAAASSNVQQASASNSTLAAIANNTCESNSYHEYFVLICPQCGQQFDLQRQWRDHINNAHDFIKRETLNFKRINSNLHECQQCFEHVSGNKLRDLQIHKFKHLPFSAYIQCRYCNASYSHMRNIQDHLKLKHRNVMQKNNGGVFDDITFPDDDTNGVGTDDNFLLE